jgi:hypothetical protein
MFKNPPPEGIPPKMLKLGERSLELARKLRDQSIAFAEENMQLDTPITSGPFDFMDEDQYNILADALVVLLGWEMYTNWLTSIPPEDKEVDPALTHMTIFLTEVLIGYEEDKMVRV